MVEKLKQHKEIILYLFFGGLTTLVSIVSYALFRLILNVEISQVISWILAVVFAYITNKIFVFETKQTEKKGLVIEFALFIAARVFSGVLEFISMSFLVKESTSKTSEMIIKIAVTIIVVILNYIFSKFIIFKKKFDKKISSEENLPGEKK